MLFLLEALLLTLFTLFWTVLEADETDSCFGPLAAIYCDVGQGGINDRAYRDSSACIARSIRDRLGPGLLAGHNKIKFCQL